MDFICSRMQARSRQPPRTYGKAQAIFAGKPSTLDAVPLVRAIDVLEHFALLLADNDPDTVAKNSNFSMPRLSITSAVILMHMDAS